MNTEALLDADFVHLPYRHQVKEFELHADAPARALAWTMRTGKSKATIDKVCRTFQRGDIDAVLCFAPNGVHANWLEVQMPEHCWPSVPYDGLVWRSSVTSEKGLNRVRAKDREKWAADREGWFGKLKALRKDRRLVWLSVNSESMTRPDVKRVVARLLKARKVFLIVDESDDFAVPGAKRTKMIRWIASKCKYKTILSGTMLTGGLLGAYSQFNILKEGALGFKRFDDFKDFFAEFETARGTGGRKYPRFKCYKNEKILRQRIARFTSVVTREDCDDMPKLVKRVVPIKPSPQQLRAYRDLHQQFTTLIGDKTVSIGERTTRFIKLQQVMSGFLKDEFGDVHTIPGTNPRHEEFRRQVFLAPGKVIVWCNFQEDMDALAKLMLADGFKFVQYHGRVSSKAKAHALATFQNSRAVKGLIGHSRAGGRGLDMSAASMIINYSHTFSARLREQGLDRATKIGGRNIQVLDFVAPGPDPYILDKIDKGINVADAIVGTGLRDFLKGIKL